MKLFAWRYDTLHDVIPAPPLGIAACTGDEGTDLCSQATVLCFGFESKHSGQVPGNFQIVAHDCPVLLPTPALVEGPIVMKLLLDERAVAVVREARRDGVEGVFEKI